jgi:hypothetical protein
VTDRPKSKTELRADAFKAIRALDLPEGWDGFEFQGLLTGFRHRWDENRQITGQMHFSALGTTPGRIEVRCGSMTVVTSIARLDKAVSLCLEWLGPNPEFDEGSDD